VSGFTRPAMPILVRLSTCIVAVIVILFSNAPLIATSINADAEQLESWPAKFTQAYEIGSFTGDGDERDADVYPDIAYDPASDRFLVVWMSLHRADSSSDGFDVYGRFLNRDAIPMGGSFLISDSNSAARSSRPSVSAGEDGFLVVWTRKGYRCSLLGQVVTDTLPKPDQVFLESSEHVHSPDVAYDPVRHRFVAAYVEGDDYQAPKMFGSDVNDCGSNPNSLGKAGFVEIQLKNGKPEILGRQILSEVIGGAFRPSIAYNSFANQYLVVWEDRRAAYGEPYLFEVYAQRLNGDLSLRGNNIRVAPSADYRNSDESANWTPRPSVAGNENGFLTSWFERTVTGGAMTWLLNSCLIPANQGPEATHAAAEITFIQPPENNAPTGFAAVASHYAAGENLLGMTSHVESVWGYYSSARIQRINQTGALLDKDGRKLDSPALGVATDYDIDDQISISIATNVDNVGRAAYVLVYSKHAPGEHSQDFDIWGSRVLLKNVNLPRPSPISPTPMAIVPSKKSVTFEWSQVENVVTYQIQVDDDYTFTYPFIVRTTNRNSITVNGIKHGYNSWRVRAQDPTGSWSTWSSPSILWGDEIVYKQYAPLIRR
jgi:hypothetical protein